MEEYRALGQGYYLSPKGKMLSRRWFVRKSPEGPIKMIPSKKSRRKSFSKK